MCLYLCFSQALLFVFLVCVQCLRACVCVRKTDVLGKAYDSSLHTLCLFLSMQCSSHVQDASSYTSDHVSLPFFRTSQVECLAACLATLFLDTNLFARITRYKTAHEVKALQRPMNANIRPDLLSSTRKGIAIPLASSLKQPLPIPEAPDLLPAITTRITLQI